MTWSFSIPNNSGKHTNSCIYTDIYTQKRYIYEYTYIQTYTITKYRSERVFMMKSFIFYVKNKSFNDRVVSLVRHGIFYSKCCHFPLPY